MKLSLKIPLHLKHVASLSCKKLHFTDQQRGNGSHKSSMQIFAITQSVVGKIHTFLS